MLCDDMPALILPLIEAAAHWPPRGALIGLDLGTKTIGVAVSDPDRKLATGIETIHRKTFTADAARLIERAQEVRHRVRGPDVHERRAAGMLDDVSRGEPGPDILGVDRGYSIRMSRESRFRHGSFRR